MMAQASFHFEPPVKDKLQIRFERFHKANPHIADKLEAMALRLHHRGKRGRGIAQLFEALRYLEDIETDGDAFKLNNDFRAFYSRLIEQRNPTLRGFFTKRKSIANRSKYGR